MAVLPNLPLLQERFKNAISGELEQHRIKDPNFEIQAMFLQYWESTATGFGFIAGDAITGAYTTIIESVNLGCVAVFFGERLAYIVNNPNDDFVGDIRKRKMCMVGLHHKYEKDDG